MMDILHFPPFLVSYAKVNHDQHANEDVVVFNFGAQGKCPY